MFSSTFQLWYLVFRRQLFHRRKSPSFPKPKFFAQGHWVTTRSCCLDGNLSSDGDFREIGAVVVVPFRPGIPVCFRFVCWDWWHRPSKFWRFFLWTGISYQVFFNPWPTFSSLNFGGHLYNQFLKGHVLGHKLAVHCQVDIPSKGWFSWGIFCQPTRNQWCGAADLRIPSGWTLSPWASTTIKIMVDPISMIKTLR